MTLRPLLQLALAAVLISPIAAHAQADTSLGTAIRGIDRVIRIRSHPSLGLTLDEFLTRLSAYGLTNILVAAD